MAFSHCKFPFLILCFIIPQLIVQAQRSRRTRQRHQQECESDIDCLNGQYCDAQESQCFVIKNAAFKGDCERNGGKFSLSLKKVIVRILKGFIKPNLFVFMFNRLQW